MKVITEGADRVVSKLTYKLQQAHVCLESDKFYNGCVEREDDSGLTIILLYPARHITQKEKVLGSFISWY